MSEKPSDEHTHASAQGDEALSMRCSDCDAEMGEAKFCPECGAPLKPAPAACPSCGHRPEVSINFCPECGTKIC